VADIQSIILFRLGKKLKYIDTRVMIYSLDSMGLMMFIYRCNVLTENNPTEHRRFARHLPSDRRKLLGLRKTPVPGSGAVHDRPGRRQRRGTPPAACQKYKEERPGNTAGRRMEVPELLGTWAVLRHRETLGALGDKKDHRRRGERRRPDGAVGTRDLGHGRQPVSGTPVEARML